MNNIIRAIDCVMARVVPFLFIWGTIILAWYLLIGFGSASSYSGHSDDDCSAYSAQIGC